MKKLSTEEMNRLSVGEFHRSPKLPLTVVLDNVRSQNNIGSIFRTADAFRVEHIALCGICSTPPHREIHKTALGAEESVAWSYHEDTDACVRELKERGYKVFAIEQVDESIKLGTQASRLHGIPGTQASRLQGNDVSRRLPSLTCATVATCLILKTGPYSSSLFVCLTPYPRNLSRSGSRFSQWIIMPKSLPMLHDRCIS